MQNKFETLTIQQLRARISDITPIIQTLFTSWNNPGTTAEIALNWRFMVDSKLVIGERVPAPGFLGLRSIDLELISDLEVDTFRHFIHNLCTDLSAEKLCLEGELLKRTQS